MTLDDLDTRLEELTQEMLKDCKEVTADKAGLNPRCYELFVADDFIATRHATALNYYGGFEYVASSFIRQVGEYTLYFVEDGTGDTEDRVQKVIDRAHND